MRDEIIMEKSSLDTTCVNSEIGSRSLNWHG
jgi:hypothetical protein